MAIDVLFLFFILTEIILYLFHLSVLVLLIAKRRSAFSGPFYEIFRLVIIADLITYVALFIIQKLPLIPWIYDIYKTSGYLFPSILYTLIPFLTCIQFLGHVLLAFNRFTLIWFPLKQNFLWNKPWYIVSLIIASFLYVLWKIAEPVTFLFPVGTIVSISMTDKKMINIYYILSTKLFLSTTLIVAVLNIFTFIKFYSQKQSSHNVISIKERNLLYVSFFVFIAQIFRTSYNINRLLVSDNEALVKFFETIVPILYDVFAWSGSISLLILSSATRKKYMEFYFCKSKNAVIHFTSTN